MHYVADEATKQDIAVFVQNMRESLDIVNRADIADIVITDDKAIVNNCLSFGIPVAAYIHKGNLSMEFPSGIYCLVDIADIEYDYICKIYERALGLPWTILTTDRLIIREETTLDVPRLWELYKDESITKYMEPLFSPIEKEIEYTRQYIRNIYGYYGYGIWVMCLKDTGEVIGRVGVEYKSDDNTPGDGLSLEMGFMLGVDYQHKGYATEACSAVVTYAKEELGASHIYAIVHPENEASLRLCRRLGIAIHIDSHTNPC